MLLTRNRAILSSWKACKCSISSLERSHVAPLHINSQENCLLSLQLHLHPWVSHMDEPFHFSSLEVISFYMCPFCSRMKKIDVDSPSTTCKLSDSAYYWPSISSYIKWELESLTSGLLWGPNNVKVYSHMDFITLWPSLGSLSLTIIQKQNSISMVSPF